MKTSPPSYMKIPIFFSAILLLLPSDCFAGPDLLIYTDSLTPVWQDASVPNTYYQNIDPVHSGLYSISINQWSPGLPWYIISPSALIDTSGYTAVNFWIYVPDGQFGAYVYAQASFSAQTLVILGPIEPNTWQEITIPLSDLGVANTPDFNGLLILNIDPNADALYYYYLDDIRLTSVPEPGAATLIALGLSGIFLRRRVE